MTPTVGLTLLEEAELWDLAAELAWEGGCSPDRDLECWDRCVADAYDELRWEQA